MNTTEYAALEGRVAEYHRANPELQKAARPSLAAELQKAFNATTEHQVELLSEANERGTKASAARDFERNNVQLAQVKEWQTELRQAEVSRNQAAFAAGNNHPLMKSVNGGGASTKARQAPSLDISDEALHALHEAAMTKSYASAAFGTKATMATTGAPQSLVPEYSNSSLAFRRDATRIRSYIPTYGTESPSVVYYRALTAAAAAAPVAEGANKPESTPTWESVTVPMSKIAHFARINDEVTWDFAAWRDVIGAEMISGLVDAENNQLLNGNGTPPNLRGLLNTTGAQTQAFSVNNQDTIAKAMTKLRTGAAFCEPEIVIMNPLDWEEFELYRVGGSAPGDGLYLVDPLTAPPLRIWGVPVVLTNRIAANTALVANLSVAAEVWVRQEPMLELHPGGTAEFIANQSLVRAEERIALTVPRPAALVIATLV